MTVFSRGVPINQFQVLFTSCIDIYFQVGTRCLCVTISLQVGTRCLCVTICLHVVTRVYNVLQVQVSPRSEVTLGNDVIHRNSTAKTGSKNISYTTDISAHIMFVSNAMISTRLKKAAMDHLRDAAFVEYVRSISSAVSTPPLVAL